MPQSRAVYHADAALVISRVCVFSVYHEFADLSRIAGFLGLVWRLYHGFVEDDRRNGLAGWRWLFGKKRPTL
jgi:hypothetical protein